MAEELIKAHQQRAELSESTRDGFFSLDREWRFTHINRHAAEKVGYKPERLLHCNIWDVFPDIKNSVMGFNFFKVMNDREPVIFEFPGVLTPRFYTCSVYPSAEGISVYWVDATSAKLNEIEMRKSKHKAEILHDVVEKLLISDNPQDVVQELCMKAMRFLNGHAFLNYLIDDEKGRLHLNACSGIDDATSREIEWLNFGQAVCGCVARDGCRIISSDIQNKSDSRTDLVKSLEIRAYVCHPLLVEQKVIGTLSFGTRSKDAFDDDEIAFMKAVADPIAAALNRVKTGQKLLKQHQSLLEAEKEKNDALNKAIKMKDDFLSIISHEFKTPLAVINSALQAMEHICRDELSERSKRFLNKIRQNSYRQLRLVNNLLDITRVNAGRIKIHKRNLDLVFITRSITDSVRLYAQQKDIKLSFTSVPKKLILGMDEEKYERILLNLLSNAIKFTPKGKSIKVKVSLEEADGGKKACVQVIDKGLGIPDDKRELIFERFGQVDSSLSRQAEGAGIGLYLVKVLVESLGGVISVKSKMGAGSTFTLLLPALEAPEPPMTEALAEIRSDNRLILATEVEFSDIYL